LVVEEAVVEVEDAEEEAAVVEDMPLEEVEAARVKKVVVMPLALAFPEGPTRLGWRWRRNRRRWER
jgi:hypothetical protein